MPKKSPDPTLTLPDSTPDAVAARAPNRSGVWRAILFALLIIWLVLNLTTAARSPTVWMDEVMFADPAINAVLGRGFVSTAWPFQNGNATFTSNSPLHSVLLVPWLSVWGISINTVRSINFMYVIIGLGLFLILLRRKDLVVDPAAQFLCAALFLGGYAMTFSYRSGRYDMLGMLNVLALAVCSTIHRPGYRLPALFLCSLPLALAGMQLLLLTAVIAGFHLLTARPWRKAMADVAAVGTGAAVGLGCWLAWMNYEGVLPAFLRAVRAMSKADRGGFERLQEVLPALGSDPSSVILLSMLILAALLLSNLGDSARREIAVAAMLSVSICVLMVIAGKYPIYYGWMGYLPLVAGTSMVVNRLQLLGRSNLAVACGIAFLIAAMPFPLRVAAVVGEWDARDYTIVVDEVRKWVKPTDTVFVSPPAYYAAKLTTPDVFVTTYGPLSDQDKAAIDVIVVDSGVGAEFVGRVGGTWKVAAHIEAKFARARLGKAAPYNMTVFLREPSGN